MPHTIAEEQLALAHALDSAALTPSGEIRSLVRLARSLQAVPDPEIDPAFAARLEARLLTEGLDELSARRWPVAQLKDPVSPVRLAAPSATVVALPRGRFVVRKAVIGMIAAAMLFALPVVSAGSALPGSPLYGAKIAKEQVELALARGPVADGFVYLRHSQRRLDEVAQLIAARRPAQVPSTLRRYDEAINKGTTLILSGTNDPAALARLDAQIRSGTGNLSRMLEFAPSGVAPSIIESITTGGEMSALVRIALGEDGVPAGPVEPAAAVSDPDAAPRSIDAGLAAAPASAGAGAPAQAIPSGNDHPRKKEEPGSYGASGSCAGLLVPDPTGGARLACGTTLTIQDLTQGPADEDASSAPPVAGCPSATTCGVYALERYRWAMNGGVVTLPFVVNPVQPWVATADAVAAAAGAARAWSKANPNVRIDYRGTTTAVPTLGDGINQIGWGNPASMNSLAQANILRVGDRVVEADIVLTATVPWGLTHDGPLKRYDIQSVLTHEFGHWLGLDHLHDADGAEQSMFARPAAGDARFSTLALGDVKAIRAAYPCGSCPMPAIAADAVPKDRSPEAAKAKEPD